MGARLTPRRLVWRLHRLRGMSPGELLHRLGDAVQRRRWRGRRARPAIADDAPLTAFPELRDRLARAAGSAAVARSLSSVQAGRLSVLGRDWRLPTHEAADSGASWFVDPVSRRLWPGAERSAFDVDVRSTTDIVGTDGRLGDVKFVWEPNRLQVLHPLAAAMAAGDARAARTAMAILRSWDAANPAYRGVNWASGIEMALRIVSILMVAVAAAPATLDAADTRLLRRLVADHADFLAAFPSRHSSANNHLIAEGLGLLVAGLLLPERGDWEAAGRAILDREAERQILADGVGAEQSPTYQAFTMEMLALGALLCRVEGRPLAAVVTSRLEAGAEFLRALMDQEAGVPAIGDDDEGRVLAQPPDREPRYVASIVAAVAGLTGRADLMPPARDEHLRDALFGVSHPPAPLDVGVRTFATGGYTTARQRIGGAAVNLVFDHGPLGYLSLAAHGHADALAVWLSIGHRQVLVDAGTYLYFAGGTRRTLLRESLSHNTLVVRGRTQSVAAPGFSWISKAAAGLESTASPRALDVSGRHDGYRRRLGVTHMRRIGGGRDGFSVEDRLVGRGGPHPCEIRFLAGLGVEVREVGGTVELAVGPHALCHIVPPDGFGVSIRQPDDAVPNMSVRFGEITSSALVVLCGDVGAPGVTTRIVVAS